MWGGGLGYAPQVRSRAQEVDLAQIPLRALEDAKRRLVDWMSMVRDHGAHVWRLG